MTTYAVSMVPRADLADQCDGHRRLCAEGWNFRAIYEETLRDHGDDENMVLAAYRTYRRHVTTCEPVEP